MLRLEIQPMSMQGGRSYQEDSFGTATFNHVACIAVADGAGGHGGGHIASQLAVRAVTDLHQSEGEFSVAHLEKLIAYSHDVVKAGQQKFERYPDMRSTIVVALVSLRTGRVLLGNVGDSRGYVYSRGELKWQTRDHSMVQQMVDAGLITAAQVRTQPQRSVLLASLGMDEYPKPHILEIPVACTAGDTILLCTDGLWEYVTEDFMASMLSEQLEPEQTLSHFEAQVLHSAPPGHDNYTALLATIKLNISGNAPDSDDTVRQADFDDTVVRTVSLADLTEQTAPLPPTTEQPSSTQPNEGST
jgi:serine/threonine protein phosphatase PrpC